MGSVEAPFIRSSILTVLKILFGWNPVFIFMLDCLEQLSIAQNYIKLKSRARKQMLKHVELGISLKTVFVQKSSLLC